MSQKESVSRLTKSFHKTQVGYIVECLEPVVGEWTIGDAIAMLPDSMTVKSVPVEEGGGVIGLAAIDTLSSKNKSIWESLKNNTVGKCVNRNTLVIDAMENVERALSHILKTKRDNIFDDYLVFHHGKYLGVGSFLRLSEQIAALRAMDLEKARNLQELLLNKHARSNGHFEIRSYINMANDLGGDFFQSVKLSDTMSVIASFDVSGKNVSAALTTSMLGSFFSTMQLGRFMRDRTPEDFVRFLNEVCCDQTPGETYVTGVLLFVDTMSRCVKMFNCGYTPVYVFSTDAEGKRSYKVLSPNIVPLGLDPVIDFEKNAKSVPISQDLRFFLYSDGLTEARDANGHMYGEDRLKQFMLATHRMKVDEFMGAFEKEISGFIGEAVLADDITAFAIQF
ncbi:MAG TPA: PP2C family protein-serine/threonine phosphatase [Spirochaetota bacterium]|nr:PP2C family protein-serine/threonine phosphatase [Spirochaetota bacterium]